MKTTVSMNYSDRISPIEPIDSVRTASRRKGGYINIDVELEGDEDEKDFMKLYNKIVKLTENK